MNKTALKELLEKEPLLPEEKLMWLDAGFYVPVPQGVGPGQVLYRSDALSEQIGSKTARLLREATIERWLAHRQEKVRVVEIDSHFDSIEERSRE